MNIVLTGMPGAGKSTIGVILAKAMRLQYADTDLFIQDRGNMTLQEIINTRGLDKFLELEEEVLTGLDLKDTVIATGGSAVLSEASMKHLKKIGIVVYLRLPFSVIEQRINNMKTRGIAMAEGQNLYDIFLQRSPLYEKYADVVIDCNRRNMERITLLIKIAAEKVFKSGRKNN